MLRKNNGLHLVSGGRARAGGLWATKVLLLFKNRCLGKQRKSGIYALTAFGGGTCSTYSRREAVVRFSRLYY